LTSASALARILTRFDFPSLAVRAYIDVPFMATIVWAAALPAFVVAAGGALIAVTGAVVASAFFPAGLPRISDGQLLLRSDTFLYCIGKK
jgi:hypothetical protein